MCSKPISKQICYSFESLEISHHKTKFLTFNILLYIKKRCCVFFGPIKQKMVFFGPIKKGILQKCFFVRLFWVCVRNIFSYVCWGAEYILLLYLYIYMLGSWVCVSIMHIFIIIFVKILFQENFRLNYPLEKQSIILIQIKQGQKLPINT